MSFEYIDGEGMGHLPNINSKPAAAPPIHPSNHNLRQHANLGFAI